MSQRDALAVSTYLQLTKMLVADALRRLGQLHSLIDTQEVADAGAALSDARDALSRLDAKLQAQYHEEENE